jgi:hypothetical protein
MTTRGGTLHAPTEVPTGDGGHPPTRLPLVVYILALGTFLMGTTEFVVAGLLPEIAGDVGTGVARAGLLITVFAVGMIVGAPLMAMLTLRLPRRLTLPARRPRPGAPVPARAPTGSSAGLTRRGPGTRSGHGMVCGRRRGDRGSVGEGNGLGAFVPNVRRCTRRTGVDTQAS